MIVIDMQLVAMARAQVDKIEGDRYLTHYVGCHLAGGRAHYACLVLKLCDELEDVHKQLREKGPM